MGSLIIFNNIFEGIWAYKLLGAMDLDVAYRSAGISQTLKQYSQQCFLQGCGSGI